jgi:hypothetical protein
METLDITSDDISAAVKAATPVADPSPAKTSDTTDKTPADATVQPAKSDEHGPLPFERHHAILSSTREEYEEKLRKTAWAERYDPRAVEKALSLAAKYEQEQVDRAKAATVGTAPLADLRAEDGTKLFSEAQNLAAIKHAVDQAVGALREEFGARVQPFETEYQARERINRDVSQIQEALTWKGFEQHMPVVTKAIAEANAKGQQLSVRDAYILHVVPLLTDATDAAIAKKKEEWLAELNETTEKTTNEVIPTRTPASSRKKDSEMSISELYKDEVAKRKAS